MSLIEWDDCFDLRIMVIDEHHRHLVSLLNNSYNCLRMNEKRKIGLIINELVDYSKYHFSTEEHMMQKYNFPSLVMHEKEHNHFSQQVDELQSKLNAGEALYNIPIVVLLKEWLMNHILVVDREMAVYLIDKGVV